MAFEIAGFALEVLGDKAAVNRPSGTFDAIIRYEYNPIHAYDHPHS